MSKRMKIQMPDTLTLEDNARLALGAIIGVADDDYDYIPFFNGDFKAKPAVMHHGNWDYGSSHGRLVDAIFLVRRMTGSDYGKEIEQHYRENLFSFLGKHGLSYRRNSFPAELSAEYQSKFKDSASMIDQRSTLLAFCTWYEETKDEKVRQAADTLCAGLKHIARKDREFWYYPASEYTDEGWPSFDAVHTRLAVDPCAFWGRQIGPLLRWHELTGNRDAFELCENFACYIMEHSSVFHTDGSWSAAHEYRDGHAHTRMGTLASLLHLGCFTGDARMIAFAKKSFDWALDNLCTSFGWTPGDLHNQQYEHETCTLSDAIDCALQLAKCGYSEYWAVAERFVRNQLTEAQLKETSWITQLDTRENDVHGKITYYRVGDRLKGAFAGYAAPNDFVYDGPWGRGHIMDVQTCCLGAGTRALYLAWENAVTRTHNGRISVNLLLNHSSHWVDVRSYLPYVGRLELDIKEELPDLLVRIPEWTPFGAVEVKISTASGERIECTGRELPWVKGRFIRIPQVHKGCLVTVAFPMMKRHTRERAATLYYEVDWQGDDVIGISPDGNYYPLYKNRLVYQNEAPCVEKMLCEYEGDDLQ